ncbi:hypothetical protein C7C46_27805 [Streptomyces tateyamensis]|uniref:PucR family transcriptional regulator n=1 Tax=Streptomyces tateyamensis TaxID=565073 RepID=A0A2V4MYZ8_9ACTN|nr:helix-turn-helix domain-containing protein [Streptomyces tateyamensis]PYC69774.1 hypothetical protein C7C46_27805 [Streptomyces tateyamensis]
MSEAGWADQSQQTLEGLLALVGERFVELGCAPRGVARPVRRLVVLDALEPPESADDLLVAIGVDPHSEAAVALVRRAGEAGAAGVVFRPVGTGASSEALREAAVAAGAAVLFRGWWTDWATAIGMLQAGLSVAREPGIAGVPLGDLPELAKAIALQVGGSVTIEDMDSNLLAYSPTGQDVDWIRIWTILGKRPPAGRMDDMTTAGFFRQLKKSTDVLYRAAQGDTPERLIVLVRAGDIPLGSIWVAAQGRPLDSPANREALRGVARVAAAHLLHDQARREGQGQLLQEAVRALLDGRESAELLATRTGLPVAERCAVLAVGVGEGAAAGAGSVTGEARGGLVRTVFRFCTERGQVSVVVPTKRGVLVLLGSLPQDRARAEDQVRLLARALAEELPAQLREREQLRGRGRLVVRVGIGEVQEGLDRAPESRRTAELALSGLLFGRTRADRSRDDRTRDDRTGDDRGGTYFARVEDVADAVALLHFADALRAARLPVQTPVGRLLAHAPRKGEASLLDTLGAFLETGEKAKAADALGVARTTYAHRLDQTVVRVSGIDLDDPDARLLAQLQLLLLRLDAATQA